MDLERRTSQRLASSYAFKMIFPEYGTRALDIPHFDSDKHMYIVDQFVTKGGNRQITYVAVSKHLVVEVIIGFYHSWTLMDKIRIMIPSVTGMNVISTYDWPQTTYYDQSALKEKVEELAIQYAKANMGIVGGGNSEQQLTSWVAEIINILFLQDIESQIDDNGLKVLKSYCSQMQVCGDYVTSDIL